MKQTKIIAALLLALFTGMMQSCLGDDNGVQEYTENQPLAGYYNQITEISTNESTIYSGVGYTMVIDYTAQKVKLQMTGLRLPDGSSYPSLTFSELPFVYKDGWIYIEAAGVSPSGGGVKVPYFDNLRIRLIYLTLNSSTRYPITDISYTVDSKYRINSLPTEYVMFGYCTVRDQNGGVYQTSGDDQSLFIYNFDVTKMQASITIGGAKFAEAMPALNMKFAEIPFTVSDTGVVTLKCEKLIPSIINGTGETQTEIPYPSFPISDLSGVYDQTYGMQLNFTCTMLDKNNEVSAVYRVAIDTKVESASN